MNKITPDVPQYNINPLHSKQVGQQGISQIRIVWQCSHDIISENNIMVIEITNHGRTKCKIIDLLDNPSSTTEGSNL
jgi:hypothetical protein